MQQEPSPDTGALFRTFESSEPSFSAPIDLTIDGVKRQVNRRLAG